MREHAVFEIVSVRGTARRNRVAVVVVTVCTQAVVGVVRVVHPARQRRNGRSQRLAVAHGIVGVVLRPVVAPRIARDRLRH